MDESEERFWKTIWPVVGNDYRNWVVSAVKLKLAADRLYASFVNQRREKSLRFVPVSKEEGIYAGPTMMLYGMAIECLLKGLAARNGFVFVDESDGEPRFQGLSSHDLVRMTEHPKVTFSISDEERGVLGQLTAFVQFAGRYPVAKAWNAGLTGLTLNDGEIYHGPIWNPYYKKSIDELIRRLMHDLNVSLDNDGLPELPDIL